jgi:hypothetical protein
MKKTKTKRAKATDDGGVVVERNEAGLRRGDLVTFEQGGRDGVLASDGGVQYPVDGEALTVLRVFLSRPRGTAGPDGRVLSVATVRNGHGHEVDCSTRFLGRSLDERGKRRRAS